MKPRIGIFVCHCGINIAATVDVEAVRKHAEDLEDVVVSRDYKYMCSDVGANIIKESIKENKLTTVVVACCSPRMHEHTFQNVISDAGLNPYMLEIANIREQCSWVHDDRKVATEKAKKLVEAAVAKARQLEPLSPSTIDVVPDALVIGGGIAGIQAALEIAENGHRVYLVEKTSTLGGRMAQLDKTFPTLDCSSCILTPKMMEVANHPNIELLTYSEVEEVEGSIGNYTVKIRKKARYVDTDKCTGCGSCAENCRLRDRIPNEFDMNLGKRSAIYLPFPQAVPLVYTIDPNHCLMLTKGKCGKTPACIEACEAKAIDFNQKDEIITVKVGAIIVATGFNLLDPSEVPEYGYTHSPNIITTLEMERLINSAGPTKGEIQLLDTKERPSSVTYILCVGSRDETTCNWCCRIGCMTALKHLYLIREKLPDVELNLCYIDIRSFGKGYEEFYRKARNLKVNLFRGRPSEVKPTKEGIIINVFDTMTNKLFEIKTDMVVLVPAVTPREDFVELARKLKISLSSDGFFLEAHPKLKPMDTATSGIFLAGFCQGPKDIQDTVAQASGAASRALTILSKEKLEAQAYTAEVNEELCSGCGICVATCAYQAIELVTEDEKTHAKVNEALCMGCGACSAACPSGAIQQRGFKDLELLPVIEVLSQTS